VVQIVSDKASRWGGAATGHDFEDIPMDVAMGMETAGPSSAPFSSIRG